MSTEEPQPDPDDSGEPSRPVDGDPPAEPPRLRRGLLGYRAGDVQAELDARRAEAEELRADVAALWLAFGQHERTIRHLIAAMEAFEGAAGALRAPPASAAPAGPEPQQVPPPKEAAPAGAPADAVPVPADVISAQLSDLGHVLDAIEQATRSL